MDGCVSGPTHAHHSLCISFITAQTMPLAFQDEHQAVVGVLLQQVGATLFLMAEEHLSLQAAKQESIEEQEDLSNNNKTSIEISEEYVPPARDHGLDDTLDEKTICHLMLQVFTYRHLLSIFPYINS